MSRPAPDPIRCARISVAPFGVSHPVSRPSDSSSFLPGRRTGRRGSDLRSPERNDGESGRSAMDCSQKLAELFRKGRRKEYRPGEPILIKGTAVDDVLLIVNGWAQVTDPHADGSETFLDLRCRGELLGDTGVLGGRPRNANVHAVRRTVTLAVGGTQFLAFIKQHDLLKQLLLSAHEQHLAANRLTGARRFGSAAVTSRLLLDLSRRCGSPTLRGITQKAMAGMLGITLPTLRKAIADLSTSGAVRAEWPDVEIRDQGVLRETARLDD
ncbi:Crp/Fnr family transcriptional regulator [Kitasatospora sp. NPDC101183]|uniref:Crp/Fnr family transcriptional regulator n=1 Tax=Kitasatospora sp. NPDC101183 TaxID=3364100 RepID=UPI0037FDAC36